jgi:hypothetical protein
MKLKHEASYSAMRLSHLPPCFGTVSSKITFMWEAVVSHMELEPRRNLDPHPCDPVA